MKKINELMRERRSARAFDENYTIPSDDLDALIESIRMTPSAWGLLTQRLIVITDKKIKQDLAPIFYNQLNFITANAYMIFLGTKPEGLQAKIKKSMDLKFGVDEESEIRTKYTQNIQNGLLSQNVTREVKWEFSIKQSFISVGVATAAAATLNIDTCIIQGFDNEKLYDYLIKTKLIQNDEFPIISMACGKSTKVSGIKTRLETKDFLILK